MPAPAPGAAPKAGSAAAASSGVFTTPPSAVGVLGDWVMLPDGSEITALPLIDTRPDVRSQGIWFARLRARDVPAALASIGADWATEADLRRAYAMPGAIWIDPVTLWRSDADSARMASEEFAARHDETVRKRAAEGGRAADLGRSVLINAGKFWLPGAPPGRAINWGWLKTKDAAGPVIQAAWHPGGVRAEPAHDDLHADYSQVIHGFRRPRVTGSDLLASMLGDR
jgi:hypothetical protein